MNKKGFTLIELLAVIIILGILMIIAIPSVTKYINDSRKNSYIDTARELVSGARNLVNDGKLEMYDTDATYYIDVACIKTENGGKAVSPYGDFVKDKAFVVVTFDGKGYDYYWTSIDDSGQGVKNLIKYDNLDPDNIESDLKTDDIAIDRGIDGRSKIILIRESNNCQKEGSIPAGSQVNGQTGEENNPITYPGGKDKDTVVIGDIVRIGTEEFYVVKHDGNNLILLSRYNLKVGDIYSSSWSVTSSYSSTDTGYGRQDSDAKGWVSGASSFNGSLKFSISPHHFYWDGKVGTDYPGTACHTLQHIATEDCAYVYDNHSNIKTYVDEYKETLEGMGAKVKEARLLSISEAYELGCGINNQWNCSSAPSWVYDSSYWLGSCAHTIYLWVIRSSGSLVQDRYYDTYGGVRPVIVI